MERMLVSARIKHFSTYCETRINLVYFLAIFVIDCNSKMFDRLEYARDVNREAESFFDLSLNVIESLLLEKLRKNNSNEMVMARKIYIAGI